MTTTQPAVFASAIEPYHRAGWPAILPVPPETKTPPPVGFTGEHGADTTAEQLAAWAGGGLGHYSVALRMPDGLLGIDVDHYQVGEKVKRGADTLAAREAAWGQLPPTWHSTARGTDAGAGPSRILFFRAEPGRYATVLGADVEIIQRHHRYAVVAPSAHVSAGAAYRWYRPDGSPAAPGEVPSPADLAELPAAWVEGLRAGATQAGPVSADHASGERLLAGLLLDERPPCSEMHDALLTALTALDEANVGTRHDAATARIHRVVNLGASGHPGAGAALAGLRERWTDLTSGEGRDAEFDSMALTSARKAVTASGGNPPAADPCLLFGGFTVAAPAPVDDRGGEGAPLPGPIQDPTPYSWRHVIGTALFDPNAGMDQTLAAAALVRVWPMLRHASDTKSGWLQRGPTQWELHGDLTRRAIAELGWLMPKGDPTKPAKGDPPSAEQRQAARRAKFLTNASAGALASAARAIVLGGWHPSTVRISDLDTDPELLWAGGMAYDLRASREGPAFASIDPHTPHLVSAGVAPDLVPTPYWDAFIAAVWPDREVRAWVMRVLSIALTGHPDAALPILLGPGGTGKTSTIELLMTVLGSYAHAANVKLLSGESSHDSIVFALKGRRLSFIDEGPREGRWAQERLKQLTGGSQLTGNAMNQNPITFSPTHTLVLTANTEPALTDEAVRRRARLIPCEGDALAVRRARKALTPRVWAAEAPGVLAKLMAEAAAWLDEPDTALTSAAPSSIRDRAEQIATEQDTAVRWLAEACEPSDQGTRSGEAYEGYVGWCRNNNVHPSRILASNLWGGRLDANGYPGVRSSRGVRRMLRIRPRGEYEGLGSPAPGPVQGVQGPVQGAAGSQANPYIPHNPTSPLVFPPVVQGVQGLLPTSTDNIDNYSIGSTGESPAERMGDFAGAYTPPTQDAPPPAETPNDEPYTGAPGPTPTQHTVTPSDVARRADQSKIAKAEARAQLKAEARLAAISEASGEVLPLPAVVDRDGNVLPISPEQAAAVVRAAIARSGALTVDVETSGYPVGHADYRLRSVQLGDQQAAVVLDPLVHPELITALLGEAPRLHAHSATADLVPLAYAGLIDAESGWERMHDTVIPAKLADPQSTGSDPGLKQLAGVVLGAGSTAPAADAGRDALFKAGRWLKATKVDTPIERSGWAQVATGSTTMLRYAASDVLDTAALAAVLPPPPPVVLERERLAQRMTARVAHHGVRIDAEHVARLIDTHTAGRAQAAARVQAFGVDNPGSAQQVGPVAAQLGATLPHTSTGRPSVAEGVLDPLRTAEGPLGEFVSAVLDYRHHDTALGLFLEPYRQLCVRGDGRARPTIYTLGTDTGRMCLPVGHRLVTPGGYLAADELRPGMETLDASGQWVRVLEVHRYDDAPIQTLSNRGIELACTPEHRWMTTREHEAPYARKMGRTPPPRVLRRLGDHPRLRVHLAPEVAPFDFDARTIPAETDGQRFAALVGMLVTDGRCVDSTEPEVGLRAYVYQTEAKFHAEFIRVLPAESIMYDRVTAAGQAHHEIRIRAKWLRPRLDAAGLRAGVLLKESPDLYRWVAELPFDELRAFFAASWLADGSLDHGTQSCGSANLRAVLTLAAYRLGVVAYTANDGPSEWSTKDRLTLRFREPVVTVRKSEFGETRSDVWCVTTETGTFTAVNPAGTVYLTGNSATRPNIQQLSREGGIRAILTADPGQLMIGADFSGVELRVAAALSQDPTLLAFLAEGRDLHGEIARQVWGPDATKANRYVAKRGVFGRIYGGGIQTLATQVGVGQDVMQQVIDTLDALTPGLTAWSASIRQAVQRGATQFVSYSGRTIYLPKDRPHAAPNYAIQGSARELLVDALVKWRDTRWGSAVLLPVHDELDVFVPEADAVEATAELVRCMETELHGVKIVADPSEPAFAWADSS